MSYYQDKYLWKMSIMGFREYIEEIDKKGSIRKVDVEVSRK